MPRVTIIADDNKVGVDGEFREIDLSDLDPDIHAVQWDGARGHIEFKTKGQPEQLITSIAPFQKYIGRWNGVPPPPPPPPPPTDDERIDNSIVNDPAIRALIRVIAEDTGRTEAVIVARMKALK